MLRQVLTDKPQRFHQHILHPAPGKPQLSSNSSMVQPLLPAKTENILLLLRKLGKRLVDQRLALPGIQLKLQSIRHPGNIRPYMVHQPLLL